MKVVEARPEDAGELSSIAHAAKGHWGYPESWLRFWEEALTVTPDYIRSHPTYGVVSEGRMVGFCALALRGDDAVLEHLWVLPSEMGKGAGRLLFEFAADLARKAGAARMRV